MLWERAMLAIIPEVGSMAASYNGTKLAVGATHGRDSGLGSAAWLPPTMERSLL